MNRFFEKILKSCGTFLLNLSKKKINSGYWKDEQYKSEADKLAHDFLIYELKKSFDLPIVSEEDKFSYPHNHNEYLMIDPIDGTASFANGFPGWVTQIAHIENGNVVEAGVYAPKLKEYYYSNEGSGVYLNNKKIELLKYKNSYQSLIDNYPKPKAITNAILNKFNIPQYIECGSISLKICRVVQGKADLFVKVMNPRDWDLAPAYLFMKEAGGIMINSIGNDILMGVNELHHDGLIASIPCKELSKLIKYIGEIK